MRECRRVRSGFLAASVVLCLLLGGCGSPGGKPDGAPTARGPAGEDTLARIKRQGVLKWGADPSGGGTGPFVYLDEKDPDKVIGFEVDIMDKFAAHMGVKHEIVRNDWDALIANLQRKSADIVINGIEINPARAEQVAFSEPYYIYEQQLTVRQEDKEKYKTLDDLKGHKIATLKAAEANNVLLKAGWTEDLLQPMPDSQTPYDELELKRVDAVLQESIIAACYADSAKKPKLYNVPQTFSPGKYAIAVRKDDAALLAEVNRVLELMKQNGELAAIYKQWHIWNEKQSEVGVKEGPAPK
jgi:polar amino acid transport system substrate-binding protein